ncbi:flagellar hook protein FlgE [Salinarimonas ramus]|uniref:Flagellar hook protein FlgE n=1 Tax=Salinarimonas ramus TaxID=690164 RepID=A0A917Q759_9HYPH|nr:flagellar hook protein FlgE [Salinarimonas ramus]GGK33147.1 flagellar hook protein FlgE [Salinarimonas ramus]
MSLYGVMRTGVSGMAAQSSKLATVADNIANANTNGYKRAQTEFSSLILGNGSGQYTSGGVTPNVRYAISQEGAKVFTTSSTDLAIEGRGFFVVSDGDGTPYLTRAGSFVPNGEGELVNAAGFKLMGMPIDGTAAPVVINGLGGLQPVNIGQTALEATPSTTGVFSANLDSGTAVGATPVVSSLVTYDNLGNERIYDISFEKTAETAPPNVVSTWTATATRRDNGNTANVTFDFDPATGRVVGNPVIAIPAVGTDAPAIDLDLSGMTQVASDYTVMQASVNGNAPSAIRDVEISDEGIVFAVFENGERRATWQLPLADVTSPDNLTPEAGNVYSLGLESGDVKLGTAGQGGLGGVVSGALEQSNVDLAAELTSMIESQRSYTANSKVFQTGSELLDVLVNLKR